MKWISDKNQSNKSGRKTSRLVNSRIAVIVRWDGLVTEINQINQIDLDIDRADLSIVG